jgi:hypothetical protein
MTNHPYAKSGGAAALLMGLLAYAASSLGDRKKQGANKDLETIVGGGN